MSQPQKVKCIQIIARRWFQTTYGNTYHSVKVFVDNKEIGYESFTYGYGDQYLTTAAKMLVKAGVLKDSKSVSVYFDLLEDKRNNPDKYLISVSDVTRKRDLAFFEGKAY